MVDPPTSPSLWERRSLDTCRGVTRDAGKGEDARMRFNKCHRPQVGDVLAPQTRLQGVGFPLDFDNSVPLCPPRAFSSRVLLTSASWDVHPFRVRRTSVTRAKRTPPVHFAIRSVAKPWTQIESLWSMAATLARPGHENFVFGDLNAWTCARYKCRMKLFESVARNPRLPSRPVSPVEPSCRSMLFNR